MKDQLPAWCGSINLLREADKVHSTLFKDVEGGDEILERAAQAVELPDDHRIPWPHKREQLFQALALEL